MRLPHFAPAGSALSCLCQSAPRDEWLLTFAAPPTYWVEHFRYSLTVTSTHSYSLLVGIRKLQCIHDGSHVSRLNHSRRSEICHGWSWPLYYLEQQSQDRSRQRQKKEPRHHPHAPIDPLSPTQHLSLSHPLHSRGIHHLLFLLFSATTLLSPSRDPPTISFHRQLILVATRKSV